MSDEMTTGKLFGAMVAIKPKSELPDDASHLDFGGEARRLQIRTTGDKETDEIIIDNFCQGIKLALTVYGDPT